MSREPRPGLSCSLSVDSFPGYLLRLYGLRQLHADGSTLCSERLTRMSGFLIHSRSRVPSKHLELNILRATLGWAPGRFRPHLRKRDRHPPAYQAPKRPGSPVTRQRSAFHLGGSGRPSALPQRSERACPSPTSDPPTASTASRMHLSVLTITCKTQGRVFARQRSPAPRDSLPFSAGPRRHRPRPRHPHPPPSAPSALALVRTRLPPALPPDAVPATPPRRGGLCPSIRPSEAVT